MWINATVAVNGPNITAVAIHDYPAEAPATGTLAKFFQTLTNKGSNMTNRILTDEQEVKAACSSCSIKFLVDEFGAGTGVLGAYQPYMHTYPEVPYITAELLIMTESNVSNADVFALRSAYNGSLFNAQGLPLPLDSLYTQILPHYDPLPLETTISAAHGAPKVFAGVSENPQSNSLTLLAVNTNTVTSVQLSVAGPIFPRSGSYSIWQANNSTNPVNGTFSHSFGFETTPSWLIPPMGVILVSVCHSNASLSSGGQYPLTFCESGLPTGTPWSVTIGTRTTDLFVHPNDHAHGISRGLRVHDRNDRGVEDRELERVGDGGERAVLRPAPLGRGDLSCEFLGERSPERHPLVGLAGGSMVRFEFELLHRLRTERDVQLHVRNSRRLDDDPADRMGLRGCDPGSGDDHVDPGHLFGPVP